MDNPLCVSGCGSSLYQLIDVMQQLLARLATIKTHTFWTLLDVRNVPLSTSSRKHSVERWAPLAQILSSKSYLIWVAPYTRAYNIPRGRKQLLQVHFHIRGTGVDSILNGGVINLPIKMGRLCLINDTQAKILKRSSRGMSEYPIIELSRYSKE